MDNNKLPKRERLSGRKRIDTLFTGGKGGFVYPFKYIFTQAAAGDGEGGISVLVSVPKRNHKRAVKRNKVRRRTREAFRQGKHALCGKAASASKQVDIALIYVSKEIEDYKIIEHAVGKILGQIAEDI